VSIADLVQINPAVHISEGNSKLGDIPSVSTIPGRDCFNCEHCILDCYALPKFRMYKGVRKNWSENSAAVRQSQKAFFGAIEAFLRKEQPSFFRFFVGGDFLNQTMVNNCIRLARRNPSVKILAFTKRHDLQFHNIPENLAILLSMFPGMPEPESNLSRSWFQRHDYSPYPKEDRIPESAVFCPGNCESCGMCWNLPKISALAGERIDVWFMDHGPRAAAGRKKAK
jgi:ferredoxin